jgi:UDP-GlcNAc:undecaprenyl-phosphate GlcNAc-1-phosphate transferase
VQYLFLFFSAAVLALILTPLAIAISLKHRIFDRPGLRKVHLKEIPCLGGAAIVLSFLVVAWLARFLWTDFFGGLDRRLLSITLGGVVIFGIGLYDDLKDASVGVRFMAQFVAAGVLIWGGFLITFLPNPFGGRLELGLLSYPFTALWIVFLVNALNFIDGLDGLASGLGIIVAAAILYVAESHGEPLIALLAAGMLGSLLGFLPFNFHPARIFMGDSGATFIGFLFAAMTTIGTMKSVAAISLLIPIAALGVPILDTVIAIVRRTWRGQKFYHADKEHVHHLLLSLGFSHQGAVVFLYGVTFFLSILSILLSSADRRLISILVLMFMLLMAIFIRKWRQQRGDQEN